MEFLKSPELQGIAAIIAVIEFSILLWDRVKPTSTPPSSGAPSASAHSPVSPSSVPARVLGLIIFLFLGWITYSFPWAVLAFGMGFPWRLVLSPTFLILGSLPPLGSIAAKSIFLGGFSGGAIPLGSLALFWASINPQMSSVGSPFAYFVVFSVFGGILGALSGSATVKLTQQLGLPLPLQ